MPSLKTMSKEAKDEAVCTLAALLLHDAGAEINADKLNEVITASGNSVEKYWPGMFAGLVSKVDVPALITASTAPSAGGSGGGAAAAPAAAAKTEKKEEKPKKEEKKEEAVEVGGADLFGGGGGGGKY
jgi:large subunit ribosomal protein LP1